MYPAAFASRWVSSVFRNIDKSKRSISYSCLAFFSAEEKKVGMKKHSEAINCQCVVLIAIITRRMQMGSVLRHRGDLSWFVRRCSQFSAGRCEEGEKTKKTL